MRRRVQVGLNKGEARNALARAVFFNRLGEMRDRSFENQNYRAGGLNWVVAAIILWNTAYLERAIAALKKQGNPVREDSNPSHLTLGLGAHQPDGGLRLETQPAGGGRPIQATSENRAVKMGLFKKSYSFFRSVR